ncbi:MAG: hypothetical protein RL754_950 [Bacteroidota bacterium]
MKRFSKIALIAAAAVSTVTFQSCTDLEENIYEDITADNFFSSEGDYYSVMVNAYGNLRPWLWNYYNISQVTSDETIVPTRGGDWGDGGVWRELHQHNFSPTNGHIVGMWNDANKGVAQTNQFIYDLEAADPSIFSVYSKATMMAEARVLRAYYYFQLMDFFGDVVIMDGPALDAANLPERTPRAEVFTYIESELKAALPDLKDSHSSDQYGRVTSWTAHGLLARMYMNAEEFTGTARWADAEAHADAIINSGEFSLEANFHDNFLVENQGNSEGVFVVPNIQAGGLGLTIAMRTLHYNQLPSSPWNGFCTLADFYNSFDTANDVRSEIFLVGQQYDFVTGDALSDRQGNPLDFTPDLPGITGASETNGIRVIKWEPDQNNAGGEAGNDYAIIRYADVLLMKAEAALRQGDDATALTIVNDIRNRAGATPLAAVTLDDILAERGFELAWEAVRRLDLIRFGKFTDQWELKDSSNPEAVYGSDHVKLLPVPTAAIGANPKIVQNAGY